MRSRIATQPRLGSQGLACIETQRVTNDFNVPFVSVDVLELTSPELIKRRVDFVYHVNPTLARYCLPVAAVLVTLVIVTAGLSSIRLDPSSEMAAAATTKRNAVVIFLHGLGDAGSSFTFMRRFKLPARVTWHFPTAPQRPITVNGGYRMNAWFDLADLPLTSSTRDDEAGFAASIAHINKIIDSEVADGIDPANIFLGGFSQGGAMTLAAGLRYPARLGGLIVVSGWLPNGMAATIDTWRSQATPPVLFAHGRDDDKVPFEMGRAAFEALRSRGYDASFIEHDGGHELPEETIKGMTDFLAKHMA